jgi:hypothetical protein
MFPVVPRRFSHDVILNLGRAEMKDLTTAESIGAVDEIVLAAAALPVFSTPAIVSVRRKVPRSASHSSG